MSALAILPQGDLAYYLLLGMVAVVNPCGFAMLPAYLSYFLGTHDTGSVSGSGAGPAAGRSDPLRAVVVAVTVSAGFLAVFALAGAAVRLASLPVEEYSPWVTVVIGVTLVALGIVLLAGFELVVNLPKLGRGGRDRSLPSMFVFGLSYAIASIGCTLPIFLGPVVGTFSRDSFLAGVVAFTVYGVGMAVVLGALTVALAQARDSLVSRLRSLGPHVNRMAGGLLLLTGAYVTYYGVLELRTFNSDGARIPSSGITDRVDDWSSHIQSWLTEAGAGRVAGALVLLTATAVAVSRLRGSRTGPERSKREASSTQV